MKSLVLRFDIDTYRCVRAGVPNLLKLAREEQVKFTFFCNMGRAISRLALLERILRPWSTARATDGVHKLPASVKLGYFEILRTLLLNPAVGTSFRELVRQIHDEGHDLGLHGGRNHGTWQHGFRGWERARIRREVAAGKAMFKRTVGHDPVLFSSPGWQESATLNRVLKDTGFKASANRHGVNETSILYDDGIYTLPTNLVAEPGGVAYFESFAAEGYRQEALLKAFRTALGDDRRLYVLYDHPCFAGIRAIENVKAIVRCAVDNGVEITTYSTLLQRRLDQ